MAGQSKNEELLDTIVDAQADSEDVVPMSQWVIENGIVLQITDRDFTNSKQEVVAYREAGVMVGLELVVCTVASGVVLKPMTQYARLEVEPKAVGRQGGGHALRGRILGATL